MSEDARRARKVRWTVRLGDPLVNLLARSWRVDEVNTAPWQALRSEGRPYIICSWHGELLIATFANRQRGFTAMVSQHTDGEIIAQVLAGWGFAHVRGSTSRGAGRALLGMIRELKDGRSFAITPDGPRGPAGVVQQGIVVASHRSGAPIVPIRAEVSRAWRAKSWDRFLLPKPFAKVRVVYGDPWVAPSEDEAAARELERRMGPALPTEL